MVKSVSPNPSMTAFAYGNSALAVKLDNTTEGIKNWIVIEINRINGSSRMLPASHNYAWHAYALGCKHARLATSNKNTVLHLAPHIFRSRSQGCYYLLRAENCYYTIKFR